MDNPSSTISSVSTSINTPPRGLFSRQPAALSVRPRAATYDAHGFLVVPEMGVESILIVTHQNHLTGLVGGHHQTDAELPQQGRPLMRTLRGGLAWAGGEAFFLDLGMAWARGLSQGEIIRHFV